VHQVHDTERNGVKLFSTPSTCAQFLPLSNSFAIDRRPPGYRWLDLNPDGTITTEVVWVEGYTP
jgi:Icc protein